MLILLTRSHFTSALVVWSWWLSWKLFYRIVLVDCLTRIAWRCVVGCYLIVSNHTAMLSSPLTIDLSFKSTFTAKVWRLFGCEISTSFEKSNSSVIVFNCSMTILHIEVWSLSSSCGISKITWNTVKTVTDSCANINGISCVRITWFCLMKRHFVVNVIYLHVILSVRFTS